MGTFDHISESARLAGVTIMVLRDTGAWSQQQADGEPPESRSTGAFRHRIAQYILQCMHIDNDHKQSPNRVEAET